MMNDLYIKWETGYMNINMDAFFPCSKEVFKKLLKIIEDSRWYTDVDETKNKLKVYFQERIERLPAEADEQKAKAAEFREKAAACKVAYSRLNSLETEYEGIAKEAGRKAKQLSKSVSKFEGIAKLL